MHANNLTQVPRNLLPHQKETRKYFWGKGYDENDKTNLPVYGGYAEAGEIVGDGRIATLEGIADHGIKIMSTLFENMSDPSASEDSFVSLRLSDELMKWREEQWAQGKILPTKGNGIKRASEEVIELLGVKGWPEPLLTNGALFGSVLANLLIGAHDVNTLYSNCCCDMGFYYEHGYHVVYPEFESVIKQASDDSAAASTPAGRERRQSVEIGLRYIRKKVELETKHKKNLAYKSAKFDRRTSQLMSLLESSIIGIAYEGMACGFDPGAAFSDMVFSCPATDVVDIGCDIHSSEVMNSFLNTKDFTETGIVTEKALVDVYDAYAHTSARLFTERWDEPTTRLCCLLYTWHIVDDRHMFYRRALLGWPKTRKSPPVQREADFDEVFDEAYHTTGFSRPYEFACDGGEICDRVQTVFMHCRPDALETLQKLWADLTTNILRYVSNGVVDEDLEMKMAEDLRVSMSQAFAIGCVNELTWLLAHAGHHGWQVNRLVEASMWGSLLDNGSMKGKLDRIEA